MARHPMHFDFFRSSSKNWRPIFIRSERDVERLNRLFDSGWHLIDLGHDDLTLFAFYVSSDELRPLPGSSEPAAAARGSRKTLMLILRRGHGESVQRAIVIPRDAAGYMDLAYVDTKLRAEEEGFGRSGKPRVAITRTLRMENDGLLAIVSWKRDT